MIAEIERATEDGDGALPGLLEGARRRIAKAEAAVSNVQTSHAEELQRALTPEAEALRDAIIGLAEEMAELLARHHDLETQSIRFARSVGIPREDVPNVPQVENLGDAVRVVREHHLDLPISRSLVPRGGSSRPIYRKTKSGGFAHTNHVGDADLHPEQPAPLAPYTGDDGQAWEI